MVGGLPGKCDRGLGISIIILYVCMCADIRPLVLSLHRASLTHWPRVLKTAIQKYISRVTNTVVKRQTV